MLSLMGMQNELLQTLWEVIAEMERTRLQGDHDQAQRLERISVPRIASPRLWGCIRPRSDCCADVKLGWVAVLDQPLYANHATTRSEGAANWEMLMLYRPDKLL